MSDLLIFIRNSVEPNMWLNVNDNREFLTQNNFRCESTLPFIPDGQHEKWKSLTIFFITTGYNENLNKKILGGSLPKWCLFTPSTFQHASSLFISLYKELN
jgi:hypothetical protein